MLALCKTKMPKNRLPRYAWQLLSAFTILMIFEGSSDYIGSIGNDVDVSDLRQPSLLTGSSHFGNETLFLARTSTDTC